jgi:hypothetical protein
MTIVIELPSRKWEIKIGDSIFEVNLLDEISPTTCKTLSKYLPHEGDALHAAWSGDCILILWEPPEKIPIESDFRARTVYGYPGDVAWNPVTNDEIHITYGYAQYRWRDGEIVHNLVGRITDKLDELTRVCKGTRRAATRGSIRAI